MVNKELLVNVNKLGVPLMAPEEEVDVNKTLAEVVKSHDTRLWENFPALLANASRKYQLDFKEVTEYLTRSVDKKALDKLSALSKALYDNYHLRFTELNKSLEQFRKFSPDYAKLLKPLRDALARAPYVPVVEARLSTDRLKSAFEDYLSRLKLEEQKDRAKHQELSLEYAQSQVFSPKQKELFNKKLNSEKLTKTEREYFSRAVKKKVVALANPELHRLAQKLLE